MGHFLKLSLGITIAMFPMYVFTAWGFTIYKALVPSAGGLAAEPWWIAALISTAIWIGLICLALKLGNYILDSLARKR